MKPLLLMFYGIIILVAPVPTAILRGLYRCCCCIPSQINYIDDCADFSDADYFDAVDSIQSDNENKSSIPDHHSDYLSSPKTDTISHDSSFKQPDISISEESDTDDSDPEEPDSEEMSAKEQSDTNPMDNQSVLTMLDKRKLSDIVNTFCNYLNVVLKRIIKDIVSIQTELASPIIKSEDIKNQMIADRKMIKRCSKEALRLPLILNPDHKYYDTMTPREIRRVLTDERKIVDSISSKTVSIGVYDIKYQISHNIYRVLTDYIHPLRSAWTKDAYSLSFLWLFERGQSIIDYLYASILKKNYLHSDSVQLAMDIFSNISYDQDLQAPIATISMHTILIFDNLAELTRRLNISSFHAFIHQSNQHKNGTAMVQTQFGIVINKCSCSLKMRIRISNEMKTVNKVISFIDDAECHIISKCTSMTIQCSINIPASIDSDGLRLKNMFIPKEREQELKTLLIDKYGQRSKDDTNFSVYIFNTSHFDQLDNFKAILLHARNYNILLLIIRAREQFIVSNFVEHNILSSEQNEKYLRQINEQINFFKEMSKEAEKVNNSLHTRIDEIGSSLGKMMDLSQSLIGAFAIARNRSCVKCSLPSNESITSAKPTLIAPKRLEKVKMFQAMEMKKKMESIIDHLVQSTVLIDTLVHHLQHMKEATLPLFSKNIAVFVSMVPTFWTIIRDHYPSFKHAKFIMSYYPSLMNLQIPMICSGLLRTMFALAQKDEASTLLIELKCIDEYFEFSMKNNGEKWGLDRIKAMDESVKREYEGLTMHTTKKVKWHHRLFGMLVMMHHMDGYCGVERLNDTYSPQSLFCRWPIVRFNADFNFTQWREQNPDEMFETKEVYF